MLSLSLCMFFSYHFPSKPNDKREQSNKIQNILTFNTHRKVNAIQWNQNNMDRNKYAKSCIILWNNVAVFGMYTICLFICFIPVKHISSRHNVSQWRQLYHTKDGYRDQTWKKMAVVFFYKEMPQMLNVNKWIWPIWISAKTNDSTIHRRKKKIKKTVSTFEMSVSQKPTIYCESHWVFFPLFCLLMTSNYVSFSSVHFICRCHFHRK